MSRNRFLKWITTHLRSVGLVLALTSLALLLPLMTAGCSHQAEANQTEKPPVVVEVATVSPYRQDLTRQIEQPGYLRPYELTPIYTKIAGFCLEWKFDIGDRVKKDELLVKLYVPEVERDLEVKIAKVEQAKADLEQAKEAANAALAGVEAAKANIDAKRASINATDAQVRRWEAEDERSRKLVERRIYDQQTADEVTNQLRTSEASRDEAKATWMSAQATWRQSAAQYKKSVADVAVAKASLDVAVASRKQWEDWLSYATIRAPYDGVVTHRNIARGDFLQPSNSGSTSKAAEPLYVLMRTDTMRCTIEVPEMDGVLVKGAEFDKQGHVIKEGDKAIVHFQAMPGVETIGDVTRTSYSLDTRKRTLLVEVFLPNADHKLRPGMYANVTILATLHNAWTLPEDSILNDILDDGDRSYCYVYEDGKVHKTFLELGASCPAPDGQSVLRQVLRKQRAGGKWEPITGKEAVVTTNPKALLDDQEVQLKAPEAH